MLSILSSQSGLRAFTKLISPLGFSRCSIIRSASSSGSATSTTFVIPDRAYLELRGKDAKTFLQGVTTNDMTLLSHFGDCVATAFLTPKGRVLADAIIYDITGTTSAAAGSEIPNGHRTETVPALLVETHASMHENLARFLSMYRLRAKLKIHTVDRYHTAMSSSPFSSSAATPCPLISTVDPRHPSIGHRLVYRSEDKWEGQDVKAAAVDRSKYSRFRMLHCLPEGAEVEGRVPMEANLDLLGYINFKKGCYVGQELVARTKHKGLVRKRFVPFIRSLSPGAESSDERAKFEPLAEAVTEAILRIPTASLSPTVDQVRPGAALVLSSGNNDATVGEVIAVSISEDMGIVKAALSDVFGGRHLSVLTAGKTSLSVNVFRPQWWPEKDPVTQKRMYDPSTF